ncbi:MAG: LysM peptidoglycan-binding domain-containing protein [Anaerolineales bacterium]|nr:LysM peptidoglycan-binding domain-containing protein [Anaerolineales bacterium]
MSNTSPRPAIPSRICPACGTRIADTAARCAVCGMVFESGTGRAVRPPARMSGTSSNLSLPVGVVIAAPVISIILGALIMVFLLRGSNAPGADTAPTAPAQTPTITLTPAPTDTLAPTHTPSPLPPIEVTVQSGDTCYGLAARYGITDISLIKDQNGKTANCDSLSLGQLLRIPQPTHTPQPASSATAGAAVQTEQSCQFETYAVVEGDTLAGIADLWNVSIESIKRWNSEKYSFANDVVYVGMVLRIPLCEREPTPGPSPTPTTPPPYPAPNLLTPRDGTIFSVDDNEIALQWAAVATLRENEEYLVAIEDISGTEPVKTMRYVKDTRLIVPVELKPIDGSMHLFRWSIMVVRKTGSVDGGNPVYVSAGQPSERRVFAWGGKPPAASTPTP